MRVKFIESFDYDRGSFEVWYVYRTRLYLVNELISDARFNFVSKEQCRYFVKQTEYSEDWDRAYRITKIRND